MVELRVNGRVHSVDAEPETPLLYAPHDHLGLNGARYDGDRNAIPLYSLPHARVVYHFIPRMPLHLSALRSLGAHLNVFAIESFMDELAKAAEEAPIIFRLRHLNDPRARDLINAPAVQFDGGHRPSGEGRGCGLGFARYKNLAAYCAVAVQQELCRLSERRWCSNLDLLLPFHQTRRLVHDHANDRPPVSGRIRPGRRVTHVS